MMKTEKTRWGILLLPLLAVAFAAIVGLGIGHKSHTADAVSTLTVGLDMKAALADPGTYGATLPAFDKCVDVKTSVNNGFFYFDVFALNVTNLYAFESDFQFPSGKMEILGSDVKQFFGASSSVSNYSQNYNSGLNAINPPVATGSFYAVGLDTGGTHTGSGVLTRIKAQAFIGAGVIPFSFNVNAALSKGVTLTADPLAYHPGDTNGDGFFDGPFINQTGTIAVDQPDSDSDGVSNTCDNCPTVANGLAQANDPLVGNQTDTDGDGAGNACDTDIDNDGVLNASDNCPTVYNPTQNASACLDSDGDGIINSVDNCPTVANGPAQANVPGVGNQTDSDGDGIGDACDTDIDNDGVLNGVDNCRYAPNPTQADWNHDGIGDACQDSDGDNVLDSVDNCKALANTDQIDTDGDGVGDICDNCPNDPNPDQADLNHNLIGDACEDSDGDGFTNGMESFVGTDPNLKCARTPTELDEPMDATPLDLNNDQKIGLGDVTYLAATFNSHGPNPPYTKRHDFNADGMIGLGDVTMFAAYFNTTCTP
jgi:Thrombospondin type 3 repeat.